ncbi:MAG TPA: DUF397 domain-containing protein [Mycobacteriales bacterium]|nr:DUF397 domain-containing protein [Mycobacteriales bacterium]
MNVVPAHRPDDPLAGVRWHISSYSTNNGGNCVEAGGLTDGSGRVAVRHSKHRTGPTLIYTHAAWTAFLAALKHDDLIR